jgi:hypothetical protein
MYKNPVNVTSAQPASLPMHLSGNVGLFQDEATTFNRVDEDITALEQGVAAPRTDKLHDTALLCLVVFGVNVEEGDFLDTPAAGILGDAADIEDAETAAVVALVGKSVVDVLVVINGVGGRFVVAGLLGVGQGRDVPDVCNWVAVRGWALLIHLVVFVVHEEPFLPLGV